MLDSQFLEQIALEMRFPLWWWECVRVLERAEESTSVGPYK